MSHAFSVSGVAGLSQSQLFERTGYSDIKLLDGYQNPVEDKWTEGITYAYRDSVSVRPVEIAFENGSLTTRIFAGSSPDDYRLALKLIEVVSELAGGKKIEPEDNSPMTPPEIHTTYDEKWIAEHSKSTLTMLINSIIKHSDTEAKLTGVHREVKIGKTFLNQLLKDKENFHKEFYRRVRRLNFIDSEDIFLGSNMVIENQEGTRKARIAAYTEGVPSLLWNNKSFTTLVSDDDLNGNGDKEQPVITMSALAELLGDEAVWLSNEFLLLPALQGEAWADMISRAKSIHIDDIFGHELAEEVEASSDQTQLSEKELAVLTYAPLLVFFTVAGADGSIDKKEMQAFQKALANGIKTDSELMANVLVRLIAHFEQLLTSLTSKEVEMSEATAAVLSVLNSSLPEDEAIKFKKSMLNIGKKVAEASGGFLGIFGSKISKEEQAALDALSNLLGVE
jgi:uncharacterized tellurite resistance protein B-like protein